ncbi:MAG: hypothetical protein QF475_01015 [Candidatus Undinarchaeales archaeon]|jgi:hypothetical protein|nr:hypothetical protein [Candidatus Undinarchaeales archaeon]
MSKHIFASFVLGSSLLYLLNMPIFSKELIVMVLVGGGVDFDHLIIQMMHGNLFHPEKMARHFAATKDSHTGFLYLFHTYEAMTLVALAGLLNPMFFFAFGAMALHFVCDAICNFRDTHTFEWIEDYSVIYYLYNRRDYHVVEKVFVKSLKMMNPMSSKSIFKLFAVYAAYVYTNPKFFFGSFVDFPIRIVKWMVSKL